MGYFCVSSSLVINSSSLDSCSLIISMSISRTSICWVYLLVWCMVVGLGLKGIGFMVVESIAIALYVSMVSQRVGEKR